MKQILLTISILVFICSFSFVPTNKKNNITGTWGLKRHVLIVNGIEQTCFDSTNKSRVSNRNDFSWGFIINKKNTSEISDATKKNLIKGKWKLSGDKQNLLLFNSYTYPTSDDGTPIFPVRFIIDRTLAIVMLAETELVVKENFCSADTIGVSYYRRVR